jgi:predicted permease
MNLFQVFLNVVLPIFILMGFGFLLDRRSAIDIKSVSRLTFYVLSPCLIFSSLVNSTLSGADSTRIFVYVIVSTTLVGVVGWVLMRGLHLDQVTRSAFFLSTLLVNSGNFGMSLNLFAFGQPGLERAALFFVVSALISNTVGVFLAARGRAGWKGALLSVLQAPLVYAAVAAFVVNATHIALPTALQKVFTTAGNGAVPVMLLILGMQLSRTSLKEDVPLIGLATVLRLVGAAGIAWGLAAVMGLEGVTRQVCIVQAATPTAVTSLILAVEYNAKPKLVTGVIFLSTLASMITLTILISILL